MTPNERFAVIGITGGIGTGKSEAGRILRDLGGFVIDSDAVAREVVEPGKPAYARIKEHFGDAVIDHSGRIDRRKLADVVFNDKEQREFLNSVTHGEILSEIRARVKEASDSGIYSFAALEVPIPVKEGFLDYAETVWFIKAPETLRVKRVAARSEMSADDAAKVIQAQMSDREYEAVTHRTIINEGDINALRDSLKQALTDFMEKRDGGY